MIRRNRAVFLIFLAGVFWSFGGVLSKFAEWNAFTLSGARSVVAVLLLGLCRGSFRPVNTKATWLGAFGVVSTAVLFMAANKLTSAANTIVLEYAMPVFVVLYQVLIRREKIRRSEILAILAVLAGVILCFAQGLTGGGMLGNALALLSALTWAIVFLAARMPGCDVQSYTYQGNLLGCLCLLAAPFDGNFSVTPRSLLVALALGLALGLGYLCFSRGMGKNVSPVTAAVVANAEPVLNPFWCFLFLGENPGPLSLTGMAVVLIAVTVYSVLASKNRREAEKTTS